MRISLLMTSYNREKYISEAIESVLNQTHTDFELIILDDCSKDNTFQIINEFAKVDKRIRAFKNERNIGQFENRNKIASFAKGDLLMYIDSDDTINTDTVAYVMKVFEQFHNAGFASYSEKIDSQNVIELSSEEVLQQHFFGGSILHHGPGATVIKKSIFEKINGFPVNYGVAGDMYYNVAAASVSSVVLMPYKYLNYRIHDGQELNNKYAYIYNGYRYFKDLMKKIDLPFSMKQKKLLLYKNNRRFFINVCKYFAGTRNIKKTIHLFKLAEFTFNDFLKVFY